MTSDTTAVVEKKEMSADEPEQLPSKRTNQVIISSEISSVKGDNHAYKE